MKAVEQKLQILIVYAQLHRHHDQKENNLNLRLSFKFCDLDHYAVNITYGRSINHLMVCFLNNDVKMIPKCKNWRNFKAEVMANICQSPVTLLFPYFHQHHVRVH